MPVVESRIEQVTLYHQGARVHRTLTLDCPDGNLPEEVEIAALPLALFDPTVRVRVARIDGQDAQVLASNVRVGLFVPPREAPLHDVDEKRLKELERTIRLRQDALQQLEAECDTLRGIPVAERPEPEEGEQPPPSPMDARLVIEQFTDEAVRARQAEIRTLRTALKALQDERAELRQKIALSSSARELKASDIRKSVTVSLHRLGGSVRSVDLSLEYYVPGARWAPTYQCRMSRDCRQADLVMRALICQRTGEDWRGVRLQLSTASPLTWTELPELSAIRIGRAQPPPPAKAGFRPPPQGARSLFADFDRDRLQLSRLAPLPPAFTPPPLPAPIDVEAEVIRSAVPQPGRLMKKRASRRDEALMSARGAPADAEMEEYDERGMDLADAVMAEAPMEAAAAMPPPPPPAPGGPPRMKMAAPAPAAPPPQPMPRGGATQGALEMVVFSHLRLPAPDQTADRSRLQPVDTRRSYMETLQRYRLNISIDVMQVVRQAASDAHAVHSMALPAGTQDVKQAAGAFDYTYATEATVDVPSDGAFHSIPVGTRHGEASVLYVVVPREEQQVYRQAMVKNPLAAPMLAGPAEVYVGGEYVLGTSLPTVASRGEFKLGLGVEQAIRCARNTTFKEQRSGTKIVATTELLHGIKVELVNNLDREIECEVRERIPHPAAGAEVVVEPGTVTPSWEPYDQEERGRALEGGYRWRVNVAPRASTTLNAEYTIKLYANNEVVGGNRREA